MAYPRYRRVNIDGQSLYKTETRKADAALLPGTFAVINATDEFANTAAVVGRMYVIDVGYHQGLGILDANPIGDSCVGNYWEEGREYAVRVAAGTVWKKDTPVTLGTGGIGAVGTEGTSIIVGYSQDAVTIGSSPDFIRVRAKFVPATPAS
jgi:hypothetical protein